MPNEKDFFNDVDFEDDLDLELTEEEILEKETKEAELEAERKKNKDAEEARKRREAEEKKQKEEAELEKQRLEKERIEAEKEAEAKTQEAKTQKDKNNQNELGKQLTDFKDKYPSIDLGKLDSDEHFKKFIDGKLLGKKDFIGLYEDYQEFKVGLTGETKEEAELRYKIKEEASTGSKQPDSQGDSDVYSKEELEKLSEQARTMSPSKYNSIKDKFERSIQHHEKNKKK